jgi:hypothetical protein
LKQRHKRKGEKIQVKVKAKFILEQATKAQKGVEI